MAHSTFSGWYAEVVRVMESKAGLHPEDLPDAAYRDMYDGGYTAAEAVAEVLAEAGFQAA